MHHLFLCILYVNGTLQIITIIIIINIMQRNETYTSVVHTAYMLGG